VTLYVFNAFWTAVRIKEVLLRSPLDEEAIDLMEMVPSSAAGVCDLELGWESDILINKYANLKMIVWK
jgi:hypothetical protein